MFGSPLVMPQLERRSLVKRASDTSGNSSGNTCFRFTTKAVMEGKLACKFWCSKCCKKFSYKTSLMLRGGESKQIKATSQPTSSTKKQLEVPCVFDGCKSVYYSAKKMQSHFM